MYSEKFSKILVWIGISCFIGGFCFFIYYQPLLKTDTPIDTEKFGQFGDLIGGIIGSFWALAGVILFYVALKEQRKDFAVNQKALNTQIDAFKQQIEEFELQRKELEETRKVFKIQSNTLRLQQFESTFFNMIEGHFTIINNIKYFETLTNELSSLYRLYKTYINNGTFLSISHNIPKELNVTLDRLSEIEHEFVTDNDISLSRLCYAQLFLTHKKNLSHYFRHLYHILKFIEKYDIQNKINNDNNENDFAEYAKILQARLSTHELILLFYNILFFPKMEKLVTKYYFLENLSVEDLISTKHKDYFDLKLISRYTWLKI